jgi:hypothetical protein
MADKDVGGQRPSENHEKDPNESIPLWLQGLSESDHTDRDEPVEPHNEVLDEDTDQVVLESAPSDGPTESDEALPDWLDEIAAADDEPAETNAAPEKAEAESEQMDEPTDEVLVEQTDVQGDEDAVSAEGEPESDDEPYVELSDLDVEDEMIPEEEDLPDWLTDMITEEPEPEEPAVEEMPDTEEAVISEADDDAGWQRLEEMPAGWMPFDDTTPVNPPEDEVPDWLKEESEEDTSPIILEETDSEEEIEPSETATEEAGGFVPIEPVETQEAPSEKEGPVDEIGEIEVEDELEGDQEDPGDSMPKTLRFAKFILDQGEVDRAMEIICTYIGQSNYLEEVESWITEAIDSGIHQSARLWEAAGDIAVAREKYTEALNAYTKAMQVLMHREEEQDEMD